MTAVGVGPTGTAATPPISTEAIKSLRDKTGAGIMECRHALHEMKGNVEQAVDFLKRKGFAAAEKKAGRAATEGVVGSYVHTTGKIGVLLEVNCETDFVARTDDFLVLVKELALHVCAMNPRYVSRDDIPHDVMEKEKASFMAEAKTQGKPEAVLEKIATGKLEKWYTEVCLLDQPFVKDPQQPVKDLVVQCIAKVGENIIVRRFVRFAIGKS